jgi:azurin
MSTDETKTSSSGSAIPPSSPPATVPTSAAASATAQESNAAAETVVAHVSIHYEQSSSSARADAERVSVLLAHAGFGSSQVLGSQHVLQEPVVRYFFTKDAEAAKRITTELHEKDARWKAEDCTRYRHKPPAGSIQVWPARIR